MAAPNTPAVPRFHLIDRQPLRPGVILLGTLVAVAALSTAVFAMGHPGRRRLLPASFSADRSPAASPADAAADDNDDPSQIDTIVLGDPADPPLPARKNNHVSPVHPTILVRLPRFGDQVGLIPDVAPGRLLYAWLAAFNQADDSALERALPNTRFPSITSAQMELRRQTGGFNLVSAKEAQPGVLVFRLRDQTPAGNEFLGALQIVPDSNPPAIATFSLAAVPTVTPQNADAAAKPAR